MKIVKVLLVLLYLVIGKAHAQFMEYEALPVIPPTQYIIPSTPSITDRIYQNRKRELELKILQQQSTLLGNLNRRNAAPAASTSLINIPLLGVTKTDKELNILSEWTKFQSNENKLVINKSTSQAKLYLNGLDEPITYDILDFEPHTGEGYTLSILRLQDNSFLSILNILKENKLLVIWGTEGEDELVLFQAVK